MKTSPAYDGAPVLRLDGLVDDAVEAQDGRAVVHG